MDENLLAGGQYARKQIFCSSRVVAFSHRARFRLARRLVEPFAGQPLLDYGCGDGTFLVLVHDLFPTAVGADVNPEQTADCAKRLGKLGGLSFVLTHELQKSRHTRAYDVVTCMETLEHCPQAQREQALLDMRRLVASAGRVVISVPLETGPSLIGKQLFRALAGWRGLGDYKYVEKYTAAELWKMVFAREGTTIARPTFRGEYPSGGAIPYHGHKGFNWRALRTEVDRLFLIEQLLFSPVRWFGPYLNSQAWLVCRPR